MSELERGAAEAAPRLVALNPKQHGGLRLNMARRYGPARLMSAVPVMLTELSEACAHYPVMFVGEENPMLVAITGFREGENLFVNPDGSWADGAYIPAVLRRMPLVLGRTDQPDNLAVLIDEGFDALSTTRGEPLFDGDQPTKITSDLIELCREVGGAKEATDAFVAAVQAEGLLAPKSVSFTIPGRGQTVVQGFSAVDPAKLNGLSDSTVVDWYRHGFIAGLYYHLASVGRWGLLIRRSQAVAESGPDNVRSH